MQQFQLANQTMSFSQQHHANHVTNGVKDEPERTQPVHRHYLRDRKGKKKAQTADMPHLPTLIPISQTNDINVNYNMQKDIEHLIIRIPITKWMQKFTEVIPRPGDGGKQQLTVSNEKQDYLTVAIRLLEEGETYVDSWGKVLWVSTVQVNSRVIKKTSKKITQQTVSLAEIKALEVNSDIFLDLFLHRQINSKVENMRGLVNQGNTCYMNSYLQMLFHLAQLRNLVFQLNSSTPGKFPATLQSVFYKLATDSKPVSTEQLSKSYGWTKKQTWVQQDVQQFSCLFFQVLEQKLNQQKQLQGSFSNLFEGKITNYIECTEVDYLSESVERFIDIQLTVSGNSSLEESLEQYTGFEMLEGDNMYYIEGLGKRTAKKGLSITKLPPVVMIQLKRFEYNPYTEQNGKVLMKYTYPAEIDFSKYLYKPTPMYKLYAVLVHQGEKAESGHYYAYIRLKDSWYKFNDEEVTTATQNQVFEFSFGGSINATQLDPAELVICNKEVPMESTAYMLVYYDSSRQQQIFNSKAVYPQWLHDEQEAKMQEERQKKLRNDICRVRITDWWAIKDFKVTSCGFINLKDTQDPDYKFEAYVDIDVNKSTPTKDWLKSIGPEAITYWMYDIRDKKEVIYNLYLAKPSPSVNDLFKDTNSQNAMIVAFSRNYRLIHYDQHTKSYVLRVEGMEQQNQRMEKLQEEQTKINAAYEASDLTIYIIKLYQVNHSKETTFRYYDYSYSSEDKAGNLMRRLRQQLEQLDYSIRFYLQSKPFEVKQLSADVISINQTLRNRMVRVVVQKLSQRFKAQTLQQMLSLQGNKICVTIRSEDQQVCIQSYFNKDATLDTIRQYIFTDVLGMDEQYQSAAYIVIKAKQTKSARVFSQVHSGTIENIVKFEKTLVFTKSSINTNQREQNSLIKIAYRLKNLSCVDPEMLKISKNMNSQQLLELVAETPPFNSYIVIEETVYLRLILMDSLQQKILRVVSPQTLIDNLLNRTKGHLFVQADTHIENGRTILCHHKTKTGEYIQKPFVLRADPKIKMGLLKLEVVEKLKDFQLNFDQKTHSVNPTKLRLAIYAKGSSSSRATQIADDCQIPLQDVFPNNNQMCLEITHMNISKSVQPMKIKIN